MIDVHTLAEQMSRGDFAALARGITWIESDDVRGRQLLQALPASSVPVLGITGPPGAGKSSLVDALLQCWVQQGRRLGVLAIDPSAPYGGGSLLGDRIRMARHALSHHVFIRSASSRGASGGLSDYAPDIIYLMQNAGFDLVITETVGIGQTELDIATLADVTVVVLTPQSGDEVQAMKSGLMDVADVFVVNKADLPGAELFANQLRQHAASRPRPAALSAGEIPVLLTAATRNVGIDALASTLLQRTEQAAHRPLREQGLALRLRRIVLRKLMQRLSDAEIRQAIARAPKPVHLYRLAERLAAQLCSIPDSETGKTQDQRHDSTP